MYVYTVGRANESKLYEDIDQWKRNMITSYMCIHVVRQADGPALCRDVIDLWKDVLYVDLYSVSMLSDQPKGQSFARYK